MCEGERGGKTIEYNRKKIGISHVKIEPTILCFVFSCSTSKPRIHVEEVLQASSYLIPYYSGQATPKLWSYIFYHFLFLLHIFISIHRSILIAICSGVIIDKKRFIKGRIKPTNVHFALRCLLPYFWQGKFPNSETLERYKTHSGMQDFFFFFFLAKIHFKKIFYPQCFSTLSYYLLWSDMRELF